MSLNPNNTLYASVFLPIESYYGYYELWIWKKWRYLAETTFPQKDSHGDTSILLPLSQLHWQGMIIPFLNYYMSRITQKAPLA